MSTVPPTLTNLLSILAYLVVTRYIFILTLLLHISGSPRDNSRCIANEIRLPLAPPTNDESSSDEYDSDEDIPTPLPPFITPSPLKNPDATLVSIKQSYL